jgi:transcriptional regulator GlxA family with amidase domain
VYLKRLRLERAAALLLATSMSIKEIAFSVGFGSTAHFSRDFKKHYGLPPTDYRQAQV